MNVSEFASRFIRFPLSVTQNSGEVLSQTTEKLINNDVNFLGGGDSPTGALNTGYNIFMYFFIVAAIIVLLILARKFLLSRAKGLNGGKYMRVFDRMMLSQDKQIAMIEISGKIIIVGITNHSIQHLYTMDRSECAELDDLNVMPLGKFGSMFADKIKNGEKKSGAKKTMFPPKGMPPEKINKTNKTDENGKDE